MLCNNMCVDITRKPKTIFFFAIQKFHELKIIRRMFKQKTDTMLALTFKLFI